MKNKEALIWLALGVFMGLLMRGPLVSIGGRGGDAYYYGGKCHAPR